MIKLITSAMTAMVLAAFSLSAQAQYIIRFSHVVAPETPKGQAAEYLARLVNERLKGRLKMVVYPDSRLYTDSKALELMPFNSGQTGLMAAPSLTKFATLSRSLQVFDLPFLFRDIHDVHKLVDSEISARMTRPLHRKGIKALSFWDNGMKVFSVRGEQPLRTPGADFAGKTFRVQASAVHEEMITALGGTPRILSFKEVYEALSRGAVDGQENSWSNINSSGFHEVQDSLTVSNHSYLGYLLVISSDFWEQLPADIQAELGQAVNEASALERTLAAQADIADRAVVTAAKGNDAVVELTPEEREAWVLATSKIEAKFSRRVGQKLLADIHRLLGH